MNIRKIVGVCAVVLIGAIACSAERSPAAAEAADTMSAVDAGPAGAVDTPDGLAAGDDVPAVDGATRLGDATEDAGPAVTFSIAAIADPHITGTNLTTKNYKRLQAAVTWLNQESEKRGIELVLVLGDIAWSGGLKPARAALDKLTVPYLPTIGDNCIHAGDEKTWSEVFGPVYADLSTKFPGLSRGVTPSTHDSTGKQELLQNVSFDLHGVHIVGLDISPRESLGLIGELGDLHDHAGGSWPWLQQDIAKVKDGVPGSVFIASHIPMHQSPGALNADDLVKVKALAATVPGLIHANIAGHYHIDAVVDIPSLPYISYVVGSVFGGPLAVHIATATVTGKSVTWTHETLALPGW